MYQLAMPLDFKPSGGEDEIKVDLDISDSDSFTVLEDRCR